MNKKNRLFKIGIAALLATLMAGSSAQVLVRALGLSGGTAPAWFGALTTALLCGMAGWSGALAIAALVLGVVTAAGALALNADGIAAIRQWIASIANSEITLDSAAMAAAGALLSAVVAVLLCALLYALLRRPVGTPFALLVYFAMLIACYATAGDLPLSMAVPGIAGALLAFAMAGEVPRDASAWRALIPVAAVICAAMLLVPAGRITWAPLENAAQTIRAAFEDYFRFTQERVPFTISTEGYNHAAEQDGAVVARLGGPASPDPEPVMKISADADVLLRGTIRRIYTGSAWEDSDAKARYLFYDFTRRGVRSDVFGMEENEGFAPVSVSVEFLAEGASSLFVPGRLDSFDMDLETAVHFNSIGELFLSRRAQPGDHYSLTGWQPASDEALRSAVLAAAGKDDDHYSAMLQSCTALPAGIEEGVYALAVELTRDLDNAYDKAAAIEAWLRSNCVYTLTPDYPDSNRDFVSQFVMDTREGYCSYFASAMTVMCRIAGLPARYVEGYYVRNTHGEPVEVTGENAHAWTEVYFSGLGWVAFNPANGVGGGEDGLSNDGVDDDDTANETNTQEDPGSGDPNETPEPDPTPDATVPPSDQSQLEGDFDSNPTPSPTPDDTFGGDPGKPSAEPTESPDPESAPLHQPGGGKKGGWLWILLIILLILALLALLYLLIRRRLDATDPIRLSARAKTAREASLILYRSILTLLAQTGQGPMSGETPGAFARRVSAQTPNPDFVAFADAVALSAYARAGANKQTVDLGRRAYRTFEKTLKNGEKLRFTMTRLLKGLGEFENIP